MLSSLLNQATNGSSQYMIFAGHRLIPGALGTIFIYHE